MPKIGINLDEIQERQPCPEDTYNLRIMKAEVVSNAKGDGRVVLVQLMPEEQPSYRVFKRWSLKPGVLSSTDPIFSFKKFLSTIGVSDALDENWDTDDIVGLTFMGKVEHEVYNDEPRAILKRILGN